MEGDPPGVMTPDIRHLLEEDLRRALRRSGGYDEEAIAAIIAFAEAQAADIRKRRTGTCYAPAGLYYRDGDPHQAFVRRCLLPANHDGEHDPEPPGRHG